MLIVCPARLAVSNVLRRELKLENVAVFEVVFLCLAIAEISPKQAGYGQWRTSPDCLYFKKKLKIKLNKKVILKKDCLFQFDKKIQPIQRISYKKNCTQDS